MRSVCICGALQEIGPGGQPLQHPPRLVISVWNCQVRLMICNGVNMQPAPRQPPHRMLERALWKAGGAINISGLYPLSPEVLRWAEKHIPEDLG